MLEARLNATQMRSHITSNITHIINVCISIIMESDKDVSQAQTLDESGASLTETARGPQSPHEGPQQSRRTSVSREILSYEAITL